MHITVYYCISMFTRENFIAKISQGQSIKKKTTQKSPFVSAIQSGKSQQWAHWSKVGDKLEGQFSNLEYTLLFPHSAEEIFVYVLPFSLLHLIFFSSSRYLSFRSPFWKGTVILLLDCLPSLGAEILSKNFLRRSQLLGHRLKSRKWIYQLLQE